MGNESYFWKIFCAGAEEIFEVPYSRWRIRIRYFPRQYIHREKYIDGMVQIVNGRECYKTHYCNAGRIKSGSDGLIGGVDCAIDALNIFHEEEIFGAMETGMNIVLFIAHFLPSLGKALLLREDEGMGDGEIAIKMAYRMGTVRSRMHRVRAEIRKRPEEYQ
ncbi:hypothetical protein [Janthinobacterium sp. HH106]|uniref:hypothetical protein n=1 Tax=Janthinobacterium sp. HH106 TaxID=1537278 RepID=UPI00111308B1|nr:hypothetical protein [Janthinobacterium sp. HH106]